MRTLPLACKACCAGALILFGVATRANALTVANWLSGAGSWSDPTKWDSNPLYPCNGNGGESFDVGISTGTATLDLACAVEAFTLSGGGVLDGTFDLTANALMTWNAGTLAGSGTTHAAGGLALGTTSTKIFSGTHRLEIAAGPRPGAAAASRSAPAAPRCATSPEPASPQPAARGETSPTAATPAAS